METFQDIPVLTFQDSDEWEQWIQANYELQSGVWVKIARKNSGIPTVSLADALDTCLCYGWIDGQRRSYDEQYFLQKYTPRRNKSLWSKVNIEKVEGLITAGRMQEPGYKEIERAKADGRWDAAYDSQKNASIPPDLQEKLDSNPQAKAFFDTMTRSERYSVLHRLMTATSPATRATRLAKMISLLEEQRKI